MPSDKKCRVLIVEDEAMISMLIEDMVLDFGSEIVGPASKVDKAMTLALEEPLDAAILDVNVDGEAVFSVGIFCCNAGCRSSSRQGTDPGASRTDSAAPPCWQNRSPTPIWQPR